MKDIVITAKRIKKEVIIMAILFLVAFLINIIAIITFKTPWHEMFTQIGYVIVMTLVLYILLLIVRGVVSLFKKIAVR